MEVIIRQEQKDDFESVFQLIEKAFEKEEYSDHKEQFLVERLRKSEIFIPELSLVAEIDGKIAGHILFTKLEIVNELDTFECLALAPVSVLPEFQGKGVGAKLILEGHNVAEKLGYKSVVLLGHENYYPKFGYERCSKYNIKMPFDVPAENCMVIPLTKDGLKKVYGNVVYPDIFFQ
ncbi:GNAT family N-acetyltransferase [Flavobacterium gelatinilyticum]|uniref:GNAT family N-acetyltransferase n=1 Tax=Flavobacterium gelatinilyticum TaxID=3003260 RepID=UPI00247FE4C1|nr:N-acetyltransferase [Flavobacterium gelatinilyticum]